MPDARADRPLLFALLALQNHFISREELLAAFSAWTLDKSQDMADLLVAHAKLRPTAAQLLTALVEEHVQQHGGTAEHSLAALTAALPVRQELTALHDPAIAASLVHVRTDAPFDPQAKTLAPTEPSPSGTRFQILRPHARGGLGEVFVARDQELGREVALKEIRTEYSDYDDARHRFVREAEVTGQLEHPGIVPVYGLGVYADGRPYYAMRFIHGESLKTAIEAFHRDRTPQTTLSGARMVQFRQLLNRLLHVCYAMHYAHSRQVLHRDLKPDNIMLGEYGETLVVDWGLAKTTDEECASTDRRLRAVSSRQSGSETLDGSALGTPEYMSPEQAAGRLDQLGPATDIYALGATLYSLLTGRPALSRQENPDILQAVERGKFPPPRSRWPKLPGALEAICLKAMQRDPAERYATARELATDIERWLADEPVAVYDEPLAARASRWMRKNPTRVAIAGTAALLLIVASLMVAGVVGRYNQVVEKANTEIRQQKENAESRRKEAETVTDILLSSFKSKQQASLFRLTTFDEVLDRATASLKNHDELSPAMKRELWTALGQSYVSIGSYKAAIDALERASQLQEKTSELDEATLLLRMDLGNAYAFDKRLAEAIQVYEPLLQQMSQKFGELDRRTQQLAMQLSSAYRSADRGDDVLRLTRERYELHRKQLGPSDERTIDNLLSLAYEEQLSGKTDDSLAHQREALAISRAAHGKDSDMTLTALNLLGEGLLAADRKPDAEALCRELAQQPAEVQARSIFSSAGSILLLLPHTTTAWPEIAAEAAKLSHRRLGGNERALLALRTGDPAEARRRCSEVLLYTQHAPVTRFIIALADYALGDTDAAQTHYKEALRDLAWLEEPAQQLRVYDRIAARALAAEAKGLLDQPQDKTEVK